MYFVVRVILLALAPVILSTTELASAAECGDLPVSNKKYSGLDVFKAGKAVGFVKRRLAVDADGAPNSYLVNGKGLSYTCDGLTALVDGKPSTPENDPEHWQANCEAGWATAKASGDYTKLKIFGFLTDKDQKNKPLVQKEGDAFPGTGFISTSSYPISDAPSGTQRAYVDATKIPYVVLSPSFRSDFAVKKGGIVVVYRPSNDTFAYGVYGDSGGLGEASIKLHHEIGNQPIVKRRGIDRAKNELNGEPILTLVFPEVHTKPTVKTELWLGEIGKLGKEALDKWGGVERLRDCAK